MRGKKNDSRARELAYQLLAAGRTPSEVEREVKAKGYQFSRGSVYNLKNEIKKNPEAKKAFNELRQLKKEEISKLNDEILNRSANELIRRLKAHPEAFPTKELITTYGIAMDKHKLLIDGEISETKQGQCNSIIALTDKLKARMIEGVEEPTTDEKTESEADGE